MSETLTIVLGPHGQVADLRNGKVKVPGCELEFIEVKRMPDAYRAMAREQPYDICEMAPTSYLMARAHGAPITALPLPMTRRFRHAGVQHMRNNGVHHPKDLEGRKVGLRAYSVTAAVWTRGIYAEEFCVDLDKITWITQEDENVPEASLPSNAKRAAASESLADMMRSGELAAAFAGLAGVGADFEGELVDVVSKAPELEHEWFKRTGIYPLHGVIVVRNDVIERLPHLPVALFEAFTQAKQNYLARIASGEANDSEDLRYKQLAEWVGDPLPYGLAENATSFEALVDYAYRQHLIPEKLPIGQLFCDPAQFVGKRATA